MGDDDPSRPLLDNDSIDGSGRGGNAFNSEDDSCSRDGEPGPAWLSERQGPLQDSPATFQGPGYLGETHAHIPTHPLPPLKHSRPSMKRTAPGTRARRQPWISIDEDGRRTLIHADKRGIIASAGLNIPIRDMRLLDFNLGSSESTILVRDNAILVSLEHGRFIVTADRVILPKEATEHNPLAARFVDLLEEAILEWTRQRKEFLQQLDAEAAAEAVGLRTAAGAAAGAGTASDIDDTSSIGTMRHGIEPLPFELVVLEAALKEAATSQAMQIKELEGVALPALDALTKSVSSANLERVRKVKTRNQRLSLRTEALRDELQRFLQDDEDMAEMCLTRRKELEEGARQAMAQGAEGATPRAMDRMHGGGGSFVPSSISRRGGLSLARRHGAAGTSPPMATSALPSREAMMAMPGGLGGGAAAVEEDADAEAQQDVENLLESYYMQVDGLYDKLVSIGEYIKDTEEYINIELDSSRNRLIRMEIILSVASFAIMPFNLLAGILGENLIIPEQITGSVSQFYGVNLAATAFCITLFYLIVLYMRHTKLI